MITVTMTMRIRAAARAKAIAKANHPYVFKGAGPDSFDCSGLTMTAWLPDVILRHNTGWQAQDLGVVEPTAANLDKLLPGDIVAYYGSWRDWRTISHVGMYTGLWLNPATSRPLHMVAQATDEAHGTEMIYMTKYAPPSGFMFVGHS